MRKRDGILSVLIAGGIALTSSGAATAAFQDQSQNQTSPTLGPPELRDFDLPGERTTPPAQTEQPAAQPDAPAANVQTPAPEQPAATQPRPAEPAPRTEDTPTLAAPAQTAPAPAAGDTETPADQPAQIGDDTAVTSDLPPETGDAAAPSIAAPEPEAEADGNWGQSMMISIGLALAALVALFAYLGFSRSRKVGDEYYEQAEEPVPAAAAPQPRQSAPTPRPAPAQSQAQPRPQPQPQPQPQPLAQPRQPAVPQAAPVQPQVPPRPQPQAAPQPAAAAPVAPKWLEPSAAPAAAPQTEQRARIELEFKPGRAAATQAQTEIQFDLMVRNVGDAPARNVRIEARMFNATAEQEIAAFFANPDPKRSVLAPHSIPPKIEARFQSSVAMPNEQAKEINVEGRRLFIPVVAFNVVYDCADGRTGQTSKSYLVGREVENNPAKMAPFRLDQGPRVYRSVGQRQNKLAHVV